MVILSLASLELIIDLLIYLLSKIPISRSRCTFAIIDAAAIDNDLLNPRFWKALEGIAEDTQSPVEATALADAIRRRSEGINLLKPLFANESLVSDSRVPLLVWWAVENRITQAEEAEY